MLDEPAAREHPEAVSLLELCNVLLRHRRVVVGVPLVAAVVVVVASLALTRSYTVTASFMPQSTEGQLSRLAGLAAQFGVSVPRVQTGSGPAFYGDLLDTRALLREAVETEYVVPDTEGGDRRRDLVTLFDIDESAPGAAVEEAIEELRERIHVTTNTETGLLRFAVTTREGWLSERVASRILELVNEFNLERRQSQALAERRFLSERLVEARDELVSAEDSLKRFLQENRRYENSPQLRFEVQRLERRVDLQQQLYTSLSESMEQAKIEAVRNTPVITIVDPPHRPARPDSRHLALKIVLALLVGWMVGMLWALGREFVERSRREDPDGYEELTRLSDRVRGDMKALVRSPTSLFRSGASR